MAGDIYLRAFGSSYPSFNPRPRMAGDACNAANSSLPKRFNPRPRMAGDGFDNADIFFGFVSIHARVWRATDLLCSLLCDSSVSIHARVWRAT